MGFITEVLHARGLHVVGETLFANLYTYTGFDLECICTNYTMWPLYIYILYVYLLTSHDHQCFCHQEIFNCGQIIIIMHISTGKSLIIHLAWNNVQKIANTCK